MIAGKLYPRTDEKLRYPIMENGNMIVFHSDHEVLAMLINDLPEYLKKLNKKKFSF